MAALQTTLDKKGIENAHFDKWHVILADERCVPLADDDSNMKSLQDKLFSKLPGIPQGQIHPINESKLSDTDSVATDYEQTVKKVLDISGGMLVRVKWPTGIPFRHFCLAWSHCVSLVVVGPIVTV